MVRLTLVYLSTINYSYLSLVVAYSFNTVYNRHYSGEQIKYGCRQRSEVVILVLQTSILHQVDVIKDRVRVGIEFWQGVSVLRAIVES